MQLRYEQLPDDDEESVVDLFYEDPDDARPRRRLLLRKVFLTLVFVATIVSGAAAVSMGVAQKGGVVSRGVAGAVSGLRILAARRHSNIEKRAAPCFEELDVDGCASEELAWFANTDSPEACHAACSSSHESFTVFVLSIDSCSCRNGCERSEEGSDDGDVRVYKAAGGDCPPSRSPPRPLNTTALTRLRN